MTAHGAPWRILFISALLSTLFGGGALWIAANGQAQGVILAVALAVGAGGLYEAVTTAIMRYRSWGWSFLHGLVSMLVAYELWVRRAEISPWAIGALVGVDFLFRAWATFMLAFAARRYPESTARFAAFDERRVGVRDRRAVAA